MANEENHPLAGVKVVEITSIYSGPMAGMLLAELGADVTKVESPDAPDVVRSGGLAPDPDGVHSTFYSLNRGKRFCAIDAKSERGRELLFDLAAGADVFFHNMRPGKADALGLTWEALAERNPRLIYGVISGLGSAGPESHLPTYDYVMQGKVGMVDHQRDLKTGSSDLVRQVVVDKTTAMGLVQAVLAALYVREKSGKGQRVEVPMIAAGLAFSWSDAMAPAFAELEPPIPLDVMPPWLKSAPGSFLVVLPTSDGEITTGILLPPWDGLCLAIERIDLVTDERFAEQLDRIMNLPALIDEVAGEVAKYTTEEILARFAEHDFAGGPVVRREDVASDPTIEHLGLISVQDAPGVGVVRQPAPMWTFSDGPLPTTTSLGRTGADSRAVLAELGLDDAEIDTLLADGTVAISDGG